MYYKLKRYVIFLKFFTFILLSRPFGWEIVQFVFNVSIPTLKALANENTLLRTHCCRNKCFPICSRAQHLLRAQILCPGHKNVSDFVQKHFVSATNVSQFAQPRKHHGQQCVRNDVSSFTRAIKGDFS